MSASSPVRPTPPRRWRRVGLGLLGLGLLAGLGAGGWAAWQRFGAGPAPDPHVYATVQRGDVEDLVTATGALQPRAYVDVGAQVSGQLKRILVAVGEPVVAGQLLAEIDAEQSAARVDANRAALAAQEATLAQREIDRLKAERDLQRQQALMAEEASTLESLQNAETTLRLVRAQIDALRAQMAQTRASMRVEEANLKHTQIYAPLAGTVVSITARQGQTLNTNQQAPTLLRIADLSHMSVQAQVSEADVGKLRAGMPVYFTTLGSQGRRWSGRLEKVEPTPTVTNNVVLYNALFEVPNPGGRLMTQMTAQVFFVAAEARDVLRVPLSALTMVRAGRAAGTAGAPAAAGDDAPAARPAARRATVRVAGADGQLSERAVWVGTSNRVQAEIRSGLAEGERVVSGRREAGSARPGGDGGARGLGPGPGFGPPPGGTGSGGGRNR